MSFYLSLCLIISAAYVAILLYNLHHWGRNTSIDIPTSFVAQKKYSVLIAARNEEKHIAACLQSILDNDFNQIEIIVIDDHSDDKTAEIIQSFPQVKLLRLQDYLQSKGSNSYKKAALNYGIQQSTGDFIICTDADCIVPPNWINHIAFHHEQYDNRFIAAPVIFSANPHWISKFEALDIIGMMGLTNAGIHSGKWFMANGANLGFCKETYLQDKPVLHQDDQLASGDDMVLIAAFAEWEQKIKFITHEEATVFSQANASIQAFIRQRLRWATKNKYNQSNVMRFIMAIPYLMAVTIMINIILALIYPKFILIILSIQLFCKIGIDFIYLSILSKHFDQAKLLKRFPLSVIKHVLYIAGIGTASFFVKQYSWKERKVQ